MPLVEEILDTLETDIANQLAGDSWFGQARQLDDLSYVTIPIITEELGDVDTAINKAVMQAGPGICLIVQALEWQIQYKNVPGPYIEKMDIVILGIENVPWNRGTAGVPSPTGTLKKIKSTMIRAQELLHLWTPPSLTRALVCDDVKLARVGNNEDGDAGIVQYTARVSAAGGTGINNVPQVATPVVTGTGPIQLSCSTAGACICYSLDNSNPSPRNGIIYTGGDIVVNSGNKLKANAWLTYSTTSEIVTQQF